MHWQVLVLGPRAHIVRTGDSEAVRRSNYFRTRHNHDSPPTIRFGSGRQAARLLSGTFRFDAAHPVARRCLMWSPSRAATAQSPSSPPCRPASRAPSRGLGRRQSSRPSSDLLLLRGLRSIGLHGLLRHLRCLLPRRGVRCRANPEASGLTVDGGYAEYVRVHRSALVHLIDGIDWTAAATLMSALVSATTMSPTRRGPGRASG